MSSSKSKVYCNQVVNELSIKNLGDCPFSFISNRSHACVHQRTRLQVLVCFILL